MDKGHMRASRADREQVVDVLKTAFVQDRLTKDELDTRVGQALSARTYADLNALTADIPAGQDLAPAPQPAPVQPARPRNRQVRTAITAGGASIATVAFVTAVIGGVIGGPTVAIGVLIGVVLITMVAAGVVAPIVLGAVALDSRQRRRRGNGQSPPRQSPPRPASGTADHTRRRTRQARPPAPGDPALAAG